VSYQEGCRIQIQCVCDVTEFNGIETALAGFVTRNELLVSAQAPRQLCLAKATLPARVEELFD